MPQYREHCRWADMDSDEQAFFADVPFSSHPSSRSPCRSPIDHSGRAYTPPRAVTSPYESSSNIRNQRYRLSLMGNSDENIKASYDRSPRGSTRRLQDNLKDRRTCRHENDYTMPPPHPENMRCRLQSARSSQELFKPCRPRGGDYASSPRLPSPSRGSLAASHASLPVYSPPRSTRSKMDPSRYPPLSEWDPPLPDPYFTESQRQPHPLQKKCKGVRSNKARAELHYRLGDVRKRLHFEGDADEDDDSMESPRQGSLQAGASAPSCILTTARRKRRERRFVFPGSDPGIVTMNTDITLSTAQARRRFAPSWAFIAWELDPDFLDESVDYYFRNKRWPEPSKLPAWLRRACRVNNQPLTQLYANEPFAPVYMFVLKKMDDEWFRWAIDYFFAEGCWPEFERLPAFLRKECENLGIGPDNYYNI